MRNSSSKSLKWLLYVIVSGCIFHFSQAAVNRFDFYTCVHDNQTKLGLVLMDCYGYDTLYSWLQKGYGILLFCDVDSNGVVKKITQIRRRLSSEKHDRLLERDTLTIRKIFNQKKIKLDLCYGSDWYVFENELTRSELANNQEFPVTIDVAFPGYLYISRRIYDKDKCIRARKLLNQIKKEYDMILDSIYCDNIHPTIY